MNSKGQSFMPDFMGSLLVFTVILSIFLFSWNSVQGNQSDFDVEDEVRRNAYYTTTFLVSTPGYPEDWTNETVDIPGFAAGSDNVLSRDKLREFRNLSYDDQKSLLDGRDFHLTFRKNGTLLQLDSEDLEYGKKPVNASLAVPVTRNVLIEGSGSMEDAEMKYVVWQ